MRLRLSSSRANRSLYLTKNCRLVCAQQSFQHHLFQIAIAQSIMAVPTHVKQDNLWQKMTILKLLGR